MAETRPSTDQRILTKLAELAGRFDELQQKMNDPTVAGNHVEFARIAKEHRKLAALAEPYHRYEQLQQQQQDAQALLADEQTDPELREMAEEELSTLDQQSQSVLTEAKEKLVMSDDAAVGSIIMEIRSGTGGDEAALFVGDLYGMYTRYAEKRRWKIEPMSFSPTELGGFREVIFCVKGEGVWQALGYEGGGHRVSVSPRLRPKAGSTPPQLPSPFCPSPKRSTLK